jgi:hypothetical protein
MGHQVIMQPNGKLAIFSDGVDGWLVSDASAEEIVEYYAERAAETARQSARETVAAVLTGHERRVYHQFTMTFAEANAHARFAGSETLEGPVDEELLAELIAEREAADNDGD